MSLKYTLPVTLLLCALCIGCGSESEPLTSKSTNYEVGEESDSSSESPASPSTTEIAETTPSSVATQTPERPTPMNQASSAPAAATGTESSDIVGPTPKQLLDVIRKMREQQPRGASQDEMIANFIDIQTKLVQAVDMLIEMKPDDKMVIEAAEAKINSLATVAQLGVEGAIGQIQAFTEELEQHPSEEIRKFGEQQSFASLLNAFSTGQVADAETVISEFKQLAEKQAKDRSLLGFGRNVAARLSEKGLMDESAQLLRYTAGLVQPTEDPQLNSAANALIEQARFAELKFSEKLNAAVEKKEGAVEEFTNMLGELTSGEHVGATTLSTFMQLASGLEGPYSELAAKVYDALEASVGKTGDDEMSEMIQDTIDKYRIRSSLVGKPFEIEGNLVDGSPFDWSKYRGKFVLVDFWATWCGPCLQEMPNIRANYEKYKEHGFEVVGINIDDDVATLKEFNSLQPLPWPSVVSADPAAVGWDHPMAVKSGVAGIPFLVLVDPEGTAIALNTRGPALGEKLAELFPEAASPSETPAATAPAASDNTTPEASTEAAPASEPKTPATDAAPAPPAEGDAPAPPSE